MDDNNQYPYQPNPAPPNQPPYPAYPVQYADDRPLSIGNYIVLMIVGAIPVVGIIMMLIWAFSRNTNTNRQNYARAMLIMMAVAIILSIIFGASIIGMLGSITGTGTGGGLY